MLKTALKTIQDEKEALQMRNEELTQELNDVKGDLSVGKFSPKPKEKGNDFFSLSKIFRQKRHRNRLSSNPSIESSEPKSPTTNHQAEQTLLIERLEKSTDRIQQLENDLKLVLCQKEELEIERDSFKTKYSKLNQEVNKMLNGNEQRIVDIELIISENRYFY